MTAPAPPDEADAADALPSRHSPIPVENPRARGAWASRCVRTLGAVMLSPRAMFERCPEPVDHGRTLQYLATLRLLPWLGLVIWLAFGYLTADATELMPSLPIHRVLEPALAEAVSTWLLLMVPVGMPLLYFCGGLLAHIGVALTGGAARSIGASMRAVGYALGPALLGIAWFDVPLYTIGLDARLYVGFIVLTGIAFFYVAAIALARTHQIRLGRGFLVAVLPMVMLIAVSAARGGLTVGFTGLEAWIEPPGAGGKYVVP